MSNCLSLYQFARRTNKFQRAQGGKHDGKKTGTRSRQIAQGYGISEVATLQIAPGILVVAYLDFVIPSAFFLARGICFFRWWTIKAAIK
jgi:hypothetical protein